MNIEEYTITKVESSLHGMGNLCFQDNAIVYCDRSGHGIKTGDRLKIESCEKGFYRSVWVNGNLVAVDDFEDAHRD